MDLSLYLVTDSSLVPTNSTLQAVVSAALSSGVRVVQLREKYLASAPFLALAHEIKSLCRRYNATFLINDRIDIALAVDADGVHIGQDDLPAVDARRLLGPHKILGLTVESPAQVRAAIASGVKIDYFGSAAVFETATKKHRGGFLPIGIDGVRDIVGAVREAESVIPVVAIGGIHAGNVEEVLKGAKVGNTGLSGIAVVSAIVAQEDPAAATKELLGLITAKGLAIGKLVTLRSPRSQLLVDMIADNLALVRQNHPLVHSITNYVVMNDTANTVLAIGGSPIMAHAVEEVGDMISFCGTLVINIGTLSKNWIEAFSIAGKRANEIKTPIVLDPVGAGATPLRQECCKKLVETLHIDIIKGNQGEISFLAGPLPESSAAQSRGVDSIGTISNPAAVVRRLSLKTKDSSDRGYGSIVAMSGAVDFVSDRFGKDVAISNNGNEWLGTITGTGCDTTALVASFAAVVKDTAIDWTPSDENDIDPYLVAAVGGLISMSIAAELAIESGCVKGSMSFKTALFDAIFGLTPETIRRRAKVDFV
ncbi:hypothetical protein HK096_000709 [Nowakowskiella sp. JEL0078]|nr:hypothetical protein HK096_000709 [Nowakowskiella sp. JEL0078]